MAGILGFAAVAWVYCLVRELSYASCVAWPKKNKETKNFFFGGNKEIWGEIDTYIVLTRSGTILGGTNALATHHHTVKVNTPKCTEFFF